jgi:GTPase Era involved in 16S rRNA processing
LAFGQGMVKVNVVELYDKIPAPPADAKAAHARLVCVTENTMQRCDAEKFYQPINSELATLQQRVEKTLAALAQPSVTAMQQIDPQEMQKKMEKMTQEEKIQFAMQMSQQMAALQKLWPEELKKRKTIYAPLQQALVSVDYGEAAVNTTFKQLFVQSQASMLTTAANLIHLSREASESAGRLWQEKLNLEKGKP